MAEHQHPAPPATHLAVSVNIHKDRIKESKVLKQKGTPTEMKEAAAQFESTLAGSQPAG
jgi:hypothetical protein